MGINLTTRTSPFRTRSGCFQWQTLGRTRMVHSFSSARRQLLGSMENTWSLEKVVFLSIICVTLVLDELINFANKISHRTRLALASVQYWSNDSKLICNFLVQSGFDVVKKMEGVETGGPRGRDNPRQEVTIAKSSCRTPASSYSLDTSNLTL